MVVLYHKQPGSYTNLYLSSLGALLFLYLAHGYLMAGNAIATAFASTTTLQVL